MVSRQSQAVVNQTHTVQPAKPSRSTPGHRSTSSPRMGNQAAQRFLRDSVIQAKLTVNQPARSVRTGGRPGGKRCSRDEWAYRHWRGHHRRGSCQHPAAVFLCRKLREVPGTGGNTAKARTQEGYRNWQVFPIPPLRLWITSCVRRVGDCPENPVHSSNRALAGISKTSAFIRTAQLPNPLAIYARWHTRRHPATGPLAVVRDQHQGDVADRGAGLHEALDTATGGRFLTYLRGDLALSLSDDPMLDTNAFATMGIGSAGNVACGENVVIAGLQARWTTMPRSRTSPTASAS